MGDLRAGWYGGCARDRGVCPGPAGEVGRFGGSGRTGGPAALRQVLEHSVKLGVIHLW